MSAQPSKSRERYTLAALLAYATAYAQQDYGSPALEIRIVLADGRKVRNTVPPGVVVASADTAAQTFVPNSFQIEILEALDGKSLRTDALGAAVGDRGRLFKPHGLKELQFEELVAHDPRLGYYRPDAPPPELAEEEA